MQHKNGPKASQRIKAARDVFCHESTKDKDLACLTCKQDVKSILHVQGKHQMKAPSKLRSKRSLRQKDPLDSLRKQVKAAGLVLSAGWHVKRIMRKNGRSAGILTRPDVSLDQV